MCKDDALTRKALLFLLLDENNPHVYSKIELISFLFFHYSITVFFVAL